MSIDHLQAHYGFTRMPFGRGLAPGMLHRHRGHAEAVARIGWCVREHALGVLTGEVGSGKTVAVRAALAGLDPSRHTLIYLGNPAVGARGLYHTIVVALGGVPRFHKAALIPQTADALAAEHTERGRQVVLVVDEAHLLDADQLEELRLLTSRVGLGRGGRVTPDPFPQAARRTGRATFTASGSPRMPGGHGSFRPPRGSGCCLGSGSAGWAPRRG